MSNTPEKDTQDKDYFWVYICDEYVDGPIPVPYEDKNTNQKEE